MCKRNQSRANPSSLSYWLQLEVEVVFARAASKHSCKKCAHGVWTCASSTSNCSQAKMITNALFEDIAN